MFGRSWVRFLLGIQSFFSLSQARVMLINLPLTHCSTTLLLTQSLNHSDADLGGGCRLQGMYPSGYDMRLSKILPAWYSAKTMYVFAGAVFKYETRLYPLLRKILEPPLVNVITLFERISWHKYKV